MEINYLEGSLSDRNVKCFCSHHRDGMCSDCSLGSRDTVNYDLILVARGMKGVHGYFGLLNLAWANEMTMPQVQDRLLDVLTCRPMRILCVTTNYSYGNVHIKTSFYYDAQALQLQS